MKKIIIKIIIIFSAKTLFGFYSDNGGYARILSVGSPEITISDIVLNFDLFSKGFTAAGFFKPIKNKIFFNAGFYPENINSDNSKTNNINFFLNNEIKKQNIFFKLNDENIITINLKANSINSEYSESNEDIALFNLIKSIKTQMITGIGYSRKITSNLALGLNINDNYVFLKTDENFEKGAEDNELKINEASMFYYTKTEYMISLAYQINKNLNIAFAFGDRKSGIPFIVNELSGLTLFNPSGEEFDYENIFFNRYNILLINETLKSRIIFDEKIYLKEQYEATGNNFDFGLEINQENIQATIIAGILLNYNYKYKSDIKDEIDYHYFQPRINYKSGFNSTYITNSFSHTVDLSLRYIADKFFIFSNKFNYILGEFDYNDGVNLYNVKIMQYNLIPGFSFDFFKIFVLLEIFLENFYVEKNNKNNFFQTNNNLFLYGFRTGIEYKTENQIYLRIGYNLTKGGSAYIEKHGENMIDENPGTDYNPFLIKSAFSFGIGHIFKDIEINLCFLNQEIFKMPSVNAYQNRINKVIIDVNKFF